MRPLKKITNAKEEPPHLDAKRTAWQGIVDAGGEAGKEAHIVRLLPVTELEE
jgi:hypothetical protein